VIRSQGLTLILLQWVCAIAAELNLVESKNNTLGRRGFRFPAHSQEGSYVRPHELNKELRGAPTQRHRRVFLAFLFPHSVLVIPGTLSAIAEDASKFKYIQL